MSQRLSDYLARETTDYLDQLDALLAAPAAPEPEGLLRLAQGVSGSARMAGFDTIAGVAERLEDAARSLLSRHVSWKLDPILLRLTRGRVSTTLMIPTAVLETRGARQPLLQGRLEGSCSRIQCPS